MRIIKLITLLLIAVCLTGCAYLTQGLFPDANRGALVTEKNDGTMSYLNPAVSEIVYPRQGWSKADSLWFYNTTQGSNLLPYDIFLHLEQADSMDSFRSNQNMQKYRYLIQKPTFGNPDGLPLGWVKDNHRGRSYVGLTCAACHTGQINYRGTGIRIDGGSTLADMEQMLYGLEKALHASRNQSGNNEKFNRLAKRVLGAGFDKPDKREAFSQRLEKTHSFIKSYTQTNYPYVDAEQKKAVHYGYARLDAFGRIFNRILANINEKPVADRNLANAPVSYPFLWDTPYHDFVQWNGIADNGAKLGLGPLGRNIGEVLGVFASIDIHYKNPGKDSRLSFLTSADSLNLARLERHLKTLKSPQWSEIKNNQHELILPDINENRAKKGRVDFISYGCIACHADIDRQDKTRRVTAQMTSHEMLGTDPTMMANAVNYCGDSGLLVSMENTPCAANGKLDKQNIAVASALSNVVTGVIKSTKDKRLDLSWTRDLIRKAYVGLVSIFGNPIRNTQRHVDLEVVNKRYLAAYKGRPLNGIWATAPYLHNGSVPSLYDLLLPKCRTGQSEEDECRPDTFYVGNPEFDPINVGYVQAASDHYPGLFEFDTSIAGNDNGGHEYAAGNTPSPVVDESGKLLRDENGKVTFDYRKPMTREQRLNMVEYLKTL